VSLINARLFPLVVAILLCFACPPGIAHQAVAGQTGVAWARSGDAPVDAAAAAQLLSLSNQVIAAIAEYQTSDAAKRGQVAARLRQLAQQRKSALQAMLEGQPGLALRSTIPHGMTQNLPPDVRQHLEQDVKVEGQVILIHGEDAQMRNAMNRYYIQTTDTQGRRAQFRVHAANSPDLPGIDHPVSRFVGQSVTLRATAIDGELLIAGAQSIEAGSTSGTTSSGSSIASGATVSGNQNTLVLTANFSDKGLSCAGTDIYNKVFGANNSVADFYRQSSKGNVTFSGTMYGPFQLTAASTNTCDFQNWSSQLENQATAQGINLSSYPRRIFVFPSSSCGVGYGSVGANPSRAWIFRCDLIDLFTHEVGHNLGFMHSSTPGSEYGDTSDVMGLSGMALRHNNAPNKVTTGWIGSSWVKSVSASGIFTLDPTASSTPVNPQVLVLPKADTGDNYFISFRQPIGYDGTLSGGYQNLVSVHRGSSSMGQYTYLLGVIGAGGSFTDAANGNTFTVNSIGTTSATVSVTTTAAPCTAAAPSVSMTPLSQSAAPGNSISYQITVTNRDSSTCAATSFAFTNLVPTGFSGANSPASLSLNSGASASSILTVTSPSTATAQSYPVSATVYETSAPTLADTVQGSYVIAAPDSIPPFNVAITLPTSGAVLKGTRVTVTASASDNVGIGRVEFYVDGALVATDTSTPYSFNWNIRKIAPGSHSLQVRAYDTAGLVTASPVVTVTK